MSKINKKVTEFLQENYMEKGLIAPHPVLAGAPKKKEKKEETKEEKEKREKEEKDKKDKETKETTKE